MLKRLLSLIIALAVPFLLVVSNIRLVANDWFIHFEYNTRPGFPADAYGFTLVGDVLGALSTEAAEPSAQELAQLADRVRAENVSVIFTENVVSSDVADALARETGVKIGGALYTDALSAAGGPADTYEKMIRANIDTLVGALK